MNNQELAHDIWKRSYATDYALLDTLQEKIKFLKDLLKENKKNIVDLRKEPHFILSIAQQANQIH